MAAENRRKKLKPNYMALGDDESFTFKHPYFFENYKFSFLGYKPKVLQTLEDIVKSMSGRICDESGYLMMDHFTYASYKGKRKCYSISYLAHSIKAEEPLDIEAYRFGELKKNAVYLDCNCLEIQNIYKAKFGQVANFKHLKCTLCLEGEVVASSANDDIFIVEE